MSNHLYYPEMGEKADSSKLFQRASHIGRFTFVDWSIERDAEARSLLRQLRIRPEIERRQLIGGREKFVARLTLKAWSRVQATGQVSIEAML